MAVLARSRGTGARGHFCTSSHITPLGEVFPLSQRSPIGHGCCSPDPWGLRAALASPGTEKPNWPPARAQVKPQVVPQGRCLRPGGE